MRSILTLSLVDVVVIGGVAVVLPLALGRWRRWALAAVGVLVALLRPVGIGSAMWVLPWLIVAGQACWSRARDVARSRSNGWGIDAAVAVVASGDAVVAASALVVARMGWQLFGIGEPIVELTAMHFTFAGVAALVLAGNARSRSGTARTVRAGTAAIVLTAAAPVFVALALGFVTGAAVPQVGGAVLLTLGVYVTCTLELIAVADARRSRSARLLLGISGLAAWIPMVLAVAWAAGEHWDVPALSIPDMERTHGLVNALAFVLCGLVAHKLESRTSTEIDPSASHASDVSSLAVAA